MRIRALPIACLIEKAVMSWESPMDADLVRDGIYYSSCESDEKVRQRRPEQLEAHDNETNDQERKMTKTQEINKKFPLWGAWAGAGLEVVAITLLMTFHIGSRALVLLGALFAFIVAVKRWNTIPEAKRIAWLVIPAVLAAALFGVYLYLRYDYLLAA